MARIIDLTHTLYHGLEGYPGNYRTELETIHDIPSGGYHVAKLTLDTHLGTHLDVPAHVLAGSGTLEQINLSKCVGPAVLLDLDGIGPNGEIEPDHFKPIAHEVREGARILIRTGWQKHFGSPGFYREFPGLSVAAAKYLAERRIALIGLEPPSVHTRDHLEVHKILLGAGIVIVEALAHLDQIKQSSFTLIALPLKIRDGDGGPVRAIAVEGDLG